MQRNGIDYQVKFAAVVQIMSCKNNELQSYLRHSCCLRLGSGADGCQDCLPLRKIFQLTFVEQPTGFEKKGDYVCQMIKTLSGVKRSPKIWYWTIAMFLKNLGSVLLAADYSVLIHHERRLTVALSVDDILILGANTSNMNRLKQLLSEGLQMTCLGPCCPACVLSLCQEIYLTKVLWNMTSGARNPNRWPRRWIATRNPPKRCTSPMELKKKYQSAVRSLMSAMLGTKPNIIFAVGVVIRYASNPPPHPPPRPIGGPANASFNTQEGSST